MAVRISAEQRDALYDRILDRLSGIEDIWLAASTERYETADRLGREYSDELRLLSDGLGWGCDLEAKTVELTTAPDVLRRVFTRLRKNAAEERDHDERSRLVAEACQVVLAALDSGEPE